jgi:hypothetical protein
LRLFDFWKGRGDMKWSPTVRHCDRRACLLVGLLFGLLCSGEDLSAATIDVEP